MGFSKYLDKASAKLQEELQKRNVNVPPQIPFSTKPTASSASAPPAETYYRLDTSPVNPVSQEIKHELGDWGWGNNELQNYTDRPANSFHTDSNSLVLRAIIDSTRQGSDRYTSARLRVKHTLARQNGYLEATISAPSAGGIWPAFWLLPSEPFNWPVDGEVDIMESWNGIPTNHSCLHWGKFEGADMKKHIVQETTINDIPNRHVYGFAWTQPPSGEGGRCLWYIDGRAVMKADRPAGTRRLEDFQVILNIAVGGNVNQGVTPADGQYDMVVYELKMCESVPGGMDRFEADWRSCRGGHGY